MPVFILEKDLQFPPVHLAEPDGLLAIGGDLSVERLLSAYKHGIFPWYEGEHILWWSPDPRCVLFPSELKISHSMKQVLRQKKFQFSINRNFAEVMNACRNAERKGQDGTWISDEMEKAYNKLHKIGVAFSAETWNDDRLVGGLYGIKLGKVFYGESMFSYESNASKFALIKFVEELKKEGFRIIDCQLENPHLFSIGARLIPREEFIKYLP